MERIEYVTAKGSVVRPYSKASWEIEFDWLEEGACVEAVPEVDSADCGLTWSCACCCDDGSWVPLVPRPALASDHSREGA